MKNNNSNIFHAYIVKLKKEDYMANVYHMAEVMLIKKEDKYYVLTDVTLDIIESGITEIKKLKEGYYFTNIEPLDEYLKSKESSNQRKRKKKNV